MIVANDLKWSEHVDRMVGKANRMLGMLKKTFESRDPKLWKKFPRLPIHSGISFFSTKRKPNPFK